jgi:drug/metabolite transporter (DMT)-like permease
MSLVFLLYALFAAVFTISKEALFHAAPFFLVGVRMFVAGLLFLGILFLRGKRNFSLSKRALGKVFLLALFNIYLTNVLEFWGLQYLTSAKTCFLYSLSPFAAAIVSFFWLGEKISPKKWLGFAVGFGGLLPILLSQTSHEDVAGTIWLFSWAELSVLVAVFTSAFGWTLLRDLVSAEGLSPLEANGYSMLLGGLFALLHSRVCESWTPVPVSSFPLFFICSALLILISNGICYNLAGFLLKRFSATFMAFAGLTTPLFTAFFGWMVHGEALSATFWLSYAIVIAGVIVFYQEEIKSQTAARGAQG